MLQLAKLPKTFLIATVISTIWLAPAPARGGFTLTTLAEFNGANGSNPSARLAQDTGGDFYGTTAAGGTNGVGTVFKVTTGGILTPLVSFNNTNGAAPFAPLLRGVDGLFYGTTVGGGANGFGTVFRITTNGTFTLLASFNSTNGARPRTGLVQMNDGSFYGTTAIGGTNDSGTAFRMAADGTLTYLFSFDTNGYTPYGGLVSGASNHLYGTTFQGGSNGNGIVFRLMTNGACTPLHLFNGNSDGANPYAGLVQALDGSLYGTAFYGGTNGFGTVFKLGTNGTFTSLLSFDGTNGAYPQAELLQGIDGNFYGTTQNGGAYTNQFGFGYGTVFRMTPEGALTTLVSFNSTNGSFPRAGLVQAADGSVYGTTSRGGASDNGTVFKLTFTSSPPPVFQMVTQTGNTLALTWSANVGRTYQMQRKTNLNQPNWSDWGSVIIATNGTMASFDIVGPDPQRFYRVVLLP